MDKLPESILSTFDKKISVTMLPRSPRQRILFARHGDSITIDPEEKFWSLLGRVIHSILEQNHEPDEVVEERLGFIYPLVLRPASKKGKLTIPAERVDIYLHGAADVYSRKEERLDDWKFTKAESMLYNKEDHEAQLNVLGYIWRKNGRPVTKLRNIYLFRNWEARNVKEGTLYPKGRIHVKEVQLWPDERVEEYLANRVRPHFTVEHLPDDDLPFCTDAERWQSDSTFKVYKVDESTGEPQKVAKYTAASKLEADDKTSELLDEEWAKAVEKNNKLAKPKPESELKRSSFVTVERKGKPLRCSYCEVRFTCNQRQAELLAELQSTEGDEGA